MINSTCINCVNYEGIRTCKAFDKEIPNIIWNGDDDHNTPIKGQGNNIVFEEVKKP